MTEKNRNHLHTLGGHQIRKKVRLTQKKKVGQSICGVDFECHESYYVGCRVYAVPKAFSRFLFRHSRHGKLLSELMWTCRPCPATSLSPLSRQILPFPPLLLSTLIPFVPAAAAERCGKRAHGIELHIGGSHRSADMPIRNRSLLLFVVRKGMKMGAGCTEERNGDGVRVPRVGQPRDPGVCPLGKGKSHFILVALDRITVDFDILLNSPRYRYLHKDTT
ncbi:hypothetical protein BHM03_00028111 [Ensete ventricosum]|nr:hypothetical protein BHM03_00028111 [Ensete ventricosum]